MPKWQLMFHLRWIHFSSTSQGLIWNHSHFYFSLFSAPLPLCLCYTISLSPTLFKHLSSVFSLKALCALWCWFLPLFTRQCCHLSFIDASSQEHIWNVTILLWLIVIACVTPLMSLASGPPGTRVWIEAFTPRLPVSLLYFCLACTETNRVASNLDQPQSKIPGWDKIHFRDSSAAA